MRSPPEWTDTQECPVDGCDGEYWRDVGGSAVRPVMEYPSTCQHDIDTCTACGSKKHIVEGFSWPVHDPRAGSPGKTRTAKFCEECSDAETIRENIPDWAFERGYVPPVGVEE